MPPFSERHGLVQPKSIRYRDELPSNLRKPIIELARRRTGRPWLVKIIAGVLDPYGIEPKATLSPGIGHRELQSPDGLDLARHALDECPWFRVYDVVESIYQALTLPVQEEAGRIVKDHAPQFENEINEYFAYAEIGWQLRDGIIKTRGDETFESTISTAVTVLEVGHKPTAARHLQFAIVALSTRPKPNTSGAVAQATNAVECVLGEITGATMTLGDYLKKNPGLFHPALKKGLDGIYGYASDEGARHGREGTEPSREEAEFAVAVCAAVCTLLTRKHPR
jgi:AbiJ-like protein